jgi:pimeloyl-ACP methyl ester carboxylesterase
MKRAAVKSSDASVSGLRSQLLALKERASFWPFLATLTFGLMWWAHSRDPFDRIRFTVKDPGGRVDGVAVIPRGGTGSPAPGLPVIVYAHGQDGHWYTDGNYLRALAQLGMAAVSFDYNPSNESKFVSEFSGVLDWVDRQKWADTNRIAWIGFSRGAQNTLRYLAERPDRCPQAYVRLAGGWIEGITSNTFSTMNVPILLVHGKNDEILPIADARRAASILGTNATLKVLANEPHDFGNDRLEVFRLVGEWCKARLTPDHPLPEFPRLNAYPFVVCILPAFLWVTLWVCLRGLPGQLLANPRSRLQLVFRCVAALLVMLALADMALRLVPRRMEVNKRTLQLARDHLVPPDWRGDFESLAALPIWQEQHVATLLSHVELAHYTTFELINWKLDPSVYQPFVLSPVIEPGSAELNWRRELWKNVWPHVRHENTTTSAAEAVVRFLRQRVTVASSYPRQPGVESIWRGRIANKEDFNLVYAAALRSVGVPAKINADHEIEYWTGKEWQLAPGPLAID